MQPGRTKYLGTEALLLAGLPPEAGVFTYSSASGHKQEVWWVDICLAHGSGGWDIGMEG